METEDGKTETIDYLIINDEGNDGCILANAAESSEESSLTGAALIIDNEGVIKNLKLDQM